MNEIKLNTAKQVNGKDGPACLSQRGKLKEIRIVANHLAVTERPRDVSRMRMLNNSPSRIQSTGPQEQPNDNTS